MNRADDFITVADRWQQQGSEFWQQQRSEFADNQGSQDNGEVEFRPLSRRELKSMLLRRKPPVELESKETENVI